MAQAQATVLTEINGLYVTLYGLPATQAGITFWENQLSKFDPSITQANSNTTAISLNDQIYLGEVMTAGSPVVSGTTYFQTRYPATMNDVAFVEALYQNMAGFAGTAAGVQYWFNLLATAEATNGGNVTLARESIVGQFTHDFLSNDLTVGAAALGVTASDYAALVAGQQTLLNKVEVSQFWANQTALDPASVLNYNTVTSPAFAAAMQLIGNITSNSNSVTAADAAIVQADTTASLTPITTFVLVPPVATTFTLTTGVDVPGLGAFAISGITGNNNLVYGIFGGSNATFTPGDQIVAPAGSTGNTLSLYDASSGSATAINPFTVAATVSNISTVNVTSGEAITANTVSNAEGFSGLTQLNVTASGMAGAAGTTAVGNSVTAAATTSIALTDINLGSAGDSVTGGLNVFVAANGVTTGTITVGATAAPAGTITITATDVNTTAANVTAGAIQTTGGTIISVAESIGAATSVVGTAYTATGGAVTITGTAVTTSASVTQSGPITAVAGVAAVAPVPAATAAATTANDLVTWQAFTAAAATEIIGGVTVTSTGVTAFTAAQVAQVVNGGTAITGLTVVGEGTTWNVAQTASGVGGTSLFTDATPSVAASLVGTGGGTGVAPTATVIIAGNATTTAGTTTAGVTAVTAVGGIVDGVVTINDANHSSGTLANTIATVTLTNFGGGSAINDNALTSLSLTGGTGTLTLTNAATTPTNTTLALALNGVGSSSNVVTFADANNEIKTLNITTGASASTVHIQDTGATTETISGAGVLGASVLTQSGSTLSGLKTIAISGAAGLVDTNDFGSSAVLTSVTDTSSGPVTLALNDTVAAFSGSTSTGTEIITIAADATKAITGGGLATDEIVFNAAATTFTAANTGANVTGFHVLGVGASGSGTFNVGASPFAGYASIDDRGVTAGAVSFTNVTGASLAIDAANSGGSVTYQVADATGATDSVAITLGVSAAAAAVDGLAATTGGFIATSNLVLWDSSLVGIGNVSFAVNNTTAGAVETLGALSDSSLSSLTITGTGGLAVTSVYVDNTAATLSITNNSTGTGGLTFSGGITDALLTTLNLSGSNTGVLNLGTVTDGTTGITVAGGTDNAAVTLTLTAASAGHTDVITLGNGNNVVSDQTTAGSVQINLGTGSNTVTTAAGATVTESFGVHTGTDAVTVGASGTSLTAIATITGLNSSATGHDTITFSDAAHGPVINENASIAAYLTANTLTASVLNDVTAVFNSGAGNLAIHDIGEFTFGGNTYLVEQANATGTALAAGDTVVALVGTTVTGLSAATAGGILHLLG